MTRQPEWSMEEFAVLMASAELPADELAATALPSRSVGAIEVVRQGVHLYHMEQPTHGILSRAVMGFLERRPELSRTMCHVCLDQT